MKKAAIEGLDANTTENDIDSLPTVRFGCIKLNPGYR